MPRRIPPPLSRREREIMDILFARGPASVADVQERLPHPPSYSAVRTLLRILEEKGHLRHHEHQGKYFYEPIVGRDTAAKSALERVLETFFAGSLEKALALRLTDPKAKLSQDQYQRLADLIDKARKQGE